MNDAHTSFNIKKVKKTHFRFFVSFDETCLFNQIKLKTVGKKSSVEQLAFSFDLIENAFCIKRN